MHPPNKVPRDSNSKTDFFSHQNTFLTLIKKMALKLKHGDAQLRSSVSSYDLKNVMSWGLFFFSIWELAELSLPKCHSFTLRVKPTEDWEVLEVRSRKVIHLFIDL